MNQDEKLAQRFGQFLVISIGAVSWCVLGLWFLGVTFDPNAWSIFLNAKIPLIWTQTTTALVTVIAVDILTPGGTIYTIMDLRSDKDSVENRRTAMWFMLGMGALAAYTVKGGF